MFRFLQRLSLSLELALVENVIDRIVFRLSFRNRGNRRWLLPLPQLSDLQITNRASHENQGWYLYCQSSTWVGRVLNAGEEVSDDLAVRPSHVEVPRDDGTDYERYCVDLPPGEYCAKFVLQVNNGYFCPDSHFRMSDLQLEARSYEASVWTGKVESNVVEFSRPPMS